VRRIAIVLGTAAVLVVVMALPAAAHVSVSPSEATKGGFATLAFQVPNEEADATTTKVQVNLPEDAPIADASVQPVPGWTVKVQHAPLTPPVTTDEGDEVDERVASVTWTATGDQGIGDGEFQEFRISARLPDDVDTMRFPTIQTYSDGTTVDWIEETPAGGPEPDHPAPEVTLANGDADRGVATTTTTIRSASEGSAGATPASAVDQDDVDSAKTLAIVALVVGIIGVLVGIGGFVLGRRRA
jgi:periplasmic copper chaperone A